MYKITIICLGKFKEKGFVELEREYLKRLSPFAKVKVTELPEIPYKKTSNLDNIKLEEAEKVINLLPKGAIVILLDPNGVERTSEDFALYLDRLGSLGQEIVFVVGSGLGLHGVLKEHSNHTISLSQLTFTHNFARVLMEEQIYRACTIIHGSPYHK